MRRVRENFLMGKVGIWIDEKGTATVAVRSTFVNGRTTYAPTIALLCPGCKGEQGSRGEDAKGGHKANRSRASSTVTDKA